MEKDRKGKKNSPPGSERSEKPSREKSEEEIEDESDKEDEEDDDEESSDVPSLRPEIEDPDGSVFREC